MFHSQVNNPYLPLVEQSEELSDVEISNALQLIDKLQLAFEIIRHNFSEPLRGQYEKLLSTPPHAPHNKIAHPGLVHRKKSTNKKDKTRKLVHPFLNEEDIGMEEEYPIQQHYIKAWQEFINKDFLAEVETSSNDVFAMDLDYNNAEIKKRCHTFSSLFHPDKNIDSKIISENTAQSIQKAINDLKEQIAPINVNDQMAEGEKYLAQATNESLQRATECFKRIISSAYFTNSNNIIKDEILIADQIKARQKLAACYEAQNAFFKAQIYIIGALRLAERSKDLPEKENTIIQLQSHLKALKNQLITHQKGDDLASNPINTSSKFSSPHYMQEITVTCQQAFSVTPDSTIVQHKMHRDLINQFNIYKKAHYIAGGTVSTLGASGGAGAIGLGIAYIIAGIVTGGIAWFVSAPVLIGAGILGGYKLVKKGKEFSKEVEIREELNNNIQAALNLYAKSEYQQFIERLADKKYYTHGEPLIQYKRNDRGYPIVLKNDKNPLGLIDTMLLHAFRPDGIAFLLNVIAEVIAYDHIDHSREAPTALSYCCALTILNEAMENKALLARATELDDELAEKDISKSNTYLETWNAYRSVVGQVGQIIPKSYIEDYKELSMINRLNEMKNTAKISYALISILLSKSDSDFSISAQFLLEIQSYYRNTPYAKLIGQRIALIRELFFAFDIPLNKTIDIQDNSELHLSLRLHYEFISSSNDKRNYVLAQEIDKRLLQLQNNMYVDTEIFALLILDRLYVNVLSGNRDHDAELLAQLADSINTAKYNIDARFNEGWRTLIRMYTRTLGIKENEEAENFLVQSLSSLKIADIATACSTLSRLLAKNIPVANNNSKLVENHATGIKAVLCQELDAFSQMIIIATFNRLTLPEQLTYIYNHQELNLQDPKLLHLWTEYFPDSYHYHIADMEDQIKKFLLSDASKADDDYCQLIFLKLNTLYGKPEDESRKNVFKTIASFLSKLNASDNDAIIWVTNSNLQNIESIKSNLILYYSLSVVKLKKYFKDDHQIYSSTHLEQQKKKITQKNPQLIDLKKQISNRIIGQQYAVELMTNTLNSLYRNQNNINQNPIVVLFCGPTGVGKTELAKILSSFIEPNKPNKERIAIFNMEKYSTEHCTSGLFGSPPGYIGSADKPYFSQAVDCYASPESNAHKKIIKNVILLFDEIEKAHHNVRQTLLTLFDIGTIDVLYTKDERKNIPVKYHFYNCIFIATSNLFSKKIIADFQNNLPCEEIAKHFSELAVQQHTDNPNPFTSEWMGRAIVVPFSPISKGEHFQKVIDNYLLESLHMIETKYRMKGRIDAQDKPLILQVLENEHYNGGISIRTFKNNLRLAFEKILSRLSFDSDDGLEETKHLVLKIDKESGRVVVHIILKALGETEVIDRDEKGNLFFLTKAPGQRLFQPKQPTSSKNEEYNKKSYANSC